MSDRGPVEPDDALDDVVRRAVVGDVPAELGPLLRSLQPIRLGDIETAQWMPAPAALQRDGDEGAAMCDWRGAGYIIVRFATPPDGTVLAIRPEGFDPSEPVVRVQLARGATRFLDVGADGSVAVPAHHAFRVVVTAAKTYVSDWIA